MQAGARMGERGMGGEHWVEACDWDVDKSDQQARGRRHTLSNGGFGVVEPVSELKECKYERDEAITVSTPNAPETNCCCKHMAEVEHGVETIIQNFEAKVVKPEVAALDLSRKDVLLKELEEALMHVEEATSAQTRTESTEGVSECQRSERPKKY